ncbi:MAG: helix-turn-helix transcriptional regulator [bacterium]
MSIEPIAKMLYDARKTIGLSQKELSRRANVSTRLVAEFERGQRPNVSLATALRLFAEVGVAVRLTDPTGNGVELGDAHRSAAARANVRRVTWSGKQTRLNEEGKAPASLRGSDRIAAVGVVSAQAFAVARGKGSRAAGSSPLRSASNPR